MFGSHTFLSQRPTFLWPLGGKIEFAVLAGKKSWLRNEGSWPVLTRGTTTGIGREQELRERDGSHKRSQNYSRKLRERTPLRLVHSWAVFLFCVLEGVPAKHGPCGGFIQRSPNRRDCGKKPILSSVYLTGSHRIFPSQWPSSQIAMGSQRFNWSGDSGPTPRT